MARIVLEAERVRRAWAARWKLDREAVSVEQVAQQLLALHATDPATLVLSVWARRPPGTVAAVAGELTRALESDRTLVRVLAMRRTLHVVPAADLPALLAVYTAKLGPMLRRNVEKYLVEAGVASEGQAAARFDALADRILAVLGDGDATVTELTAAIPELAAKFGGTSGKAYDTEVPIGGRLVDAVGAGGLLVRARSRGSWKTSTCSWSRLDRWLPDLPPAPPVDEAHTRLVRRYVSAFGPVTVDDIVWWTGLAKGPIRSALGALGKEVVEVEVRGWSGPRVALATQLEALSEDGGPAGVSLLPALDPSVMGFTERDPVLDPAWKPLLYDRSGNLAPTIWADGRVVGAWAQPKSGEVRWRLLADADPEQVAAAAAELERALEGARVAPRFPTPITKELAA